MAKLPILMYHSICDPSFSAKNLTVNDKNFEAQLSYLKSNGYASYFFSELQDIEALPKKSVIITFDDVYVSQLTYALPLLKKYNFKATFFIPIKYIGKTDSWNTNELPIMTLDQLKSLPNTVIELGLHSFEHKKYHEMTLEDIQEDFNCCKRFIIKHKLDVKNVLAYPYGKYPRNKEDKQRFFELLYKNKMSYALRIGNKVNRYPFKNRYEIKRLDIKGEDSLKTFKRKLMYGKLF